MAYQILDNGNYYCDCLDDWGGNHKERQLEFMNGFQHKLHTGGVTDAEADEYYSWGSDVLKNRVAK